MKCSKCDIEIPVKERIKSIKLCLTCRRVKYHKCYAKNKEKKLKYQLKYHLKNKEKIYSSRKKYRLKNKEKINKKQREYKASLSEEKKDSLLKERRDKRNSNKEEYNKERKLYLDKNRTRINNVANIRRRKLRKASSCFKLKENVSRSIRRRMLQSGGNKRGISCEKYLPYTIKELKDHLNSKFELWMNWDNYGKYTKQTWDNNDKSTWKWNIDHIVPQCELPYNSMEHENFKKCWNLNNLRPLSAKKNFLRGCKQRRIKK